ncbi:hypothetical protein ACIGEO_18550 [Stenotrophomonas bentonitica]|uniref:hypothetical protein n=1 Tax=Stenotrophomonas bentonitica TaxID=1450134 RepID=UPI0037D4ED7D
MGAAEKLDLSGKDWLTVEEAAHYCGVFNSQFRKNALSYGLKPRRFMGKQLYEKAALYAAIEGAEEWQRFDSTDAAQRPISTGRKAVSAFVGPLGNLTPVRRREFVPRKKPS